MMRAGSRMHPGSWFWNVESLEVLDFVHNVLTLDHLTLRNQGMTMLSNLRDVFSDQFVGHMRVFLETGHSTSNLLSNTDVWCVFLSLTVWTPLSLSLSLWDALTLNTQTAWVFFGVLDTNVTVCKTILQNLFWYVWLLIAYGGQNSWIPLKLLKCRLESKNMDIPMSACQHELLQHPGFLGSI